MSNDNGVVPNPALREAATQCAFHINLTRNMVAVLNAVAHGTREVSGPAERVWVPTAWSLKRRGLVVHVTDPEGWGPDLPEPDGMGRTRGMCDHLQAQLGINAAYRLTRAGWLTHDLLAEAGLVDRVTSRKQRRMVA